MGDFGASSAVLPHGLGLQTAVSGERTAVTLSFLKQAGGCLLIALLVISAILDFPITFIFFIQEAGKSLIESRQR
jgi:hypothetical protein